MTFKDVQRQLVSVSKCRGEKFAASLASLKKSCSDFLLDILKNPPGGDTRLREDDVSVFQRHSRELSSLQILCVYIVIVLDQDDKTTPEGYDLSKSSEASNNPSTSSDTQTPDANDEVNTVTTVRIPYITLNGNTAEVDKVDEVMKEAKNLNAVVISTQSEAEAFIVLWMDQE